MRRATALVLLVVLAPQPALADLTKSQCIDANTKGQALRLDHKLAAARQQLSVCSDPSCPELVREDCESRLREIAQAQPTVVFSVIDEGALPLDKVQVGVDGSRVLEDVGRDPVAVEPGQHTFTFLALGRAPVTRTIAIAEGVKDRREQIVFGPLLPTTPPPQLTPPVETPTPRPPEKEPSAGLSGRQIGAIAVIGAGAGSIVLGSVFGALTFSAVGRQNSDCASATSCANYTQALADHSDAQTNGAVSTATFILGVGLIAAGVVLWLTAPHARQATSASVIFTRGFSLRGEF